MRFSIVVKTVIGAIETIAVISTNLVNGLPFIFNTFPKRKENKEQIAAGTPYVANG